MGLSSEPHSEVSHHNKVESAGSFKIHYDLQSYQCVVNFLCTCTFKSACQMCASTVMNSAAMRFETLPTSQNVPPSSGLAWWIYALKAIK